MKKRFLAVACTIALTLGLFLMGCQQQEEAAKETGGYGEKSDAGGYGEKSEAGGYGEEKAAEAGGYGEEKAADTGGYGEKSDTGGYK